MSATQLDPARAEEFGGRMIGVMNGAFTALMISVGHRTGLFDTLATLAPSTSDEVAGAAGLNERYVREWLNGMTVARIVDYDPAKKTYTLPPEHAAMLTRAAGPANLAGMAQFTAQLGGVEDGIVECFRNGGGVPYSKFPKFQDLMAQMSAQVHDAALIDGELALVDGLLDRLHSGIDVLDVGCGQGHAVNLMAKEFPNSRFTGLDFSEDGVAAAQKEAAESGLTNTQFEVRDAATLDGSTQYDLVTVFDAVHDQAQPAKVLKGIADSLRPDGVFLCVDIAASSNVEQNMDHPLGPMLYSVSTFHCMTVSLALDGAGLGTVWGEQKATEMFAEAGFSTIETKRIPEDMMNAYYVCRK
ncbi:MAG: class I SAM-dependent methyltransferase [Actinobacteria bacterium]|nr:class I SAM-dependent methyltransferase [Actinomycetota bacterium]